MVRSTLRRLARLPLAPVRRAARRVVEDWAAGRGSELEDEAEALRQQVAALEERLSEVVDRLQRTAELLEEQGS